MHLYHGTSEQFIADAVQARLATHLSDRFFQEFRYKPPLSEVNAWRNSLGAMANVLQLADLRDQGVLVELKLPLSSKRLDVMLTGTNPIVGDAAVIIELKQWTEVGRSNISDCVTVEYAGGHEKDVLHPSKQVAQYQRYLQDTHPAFSEGEIELNACSYLHNAQRDPSSPLYADDFEALLALNPMFTGTDVNKFASFLEEHVVGADDDNRILEKVAATAFHPHKRLLDYVARVIQNDPVFTLLDEQLVAFNAIMDSVKSAGQNKQQVVFLVQGGPGTGKSVIAVNLVAELSALGLRTLHLTGSKAFTENLRKIVGTRAGAVFKYFRDTANVVPDDKLDVAILDEAHRIRTISTNRFTPAKARNGKAQIDDILDSTRTAVFFIDDLQVVRPGEVGSTDLIREAAAKRSIEVREFELEAQFRSNGSDSFIQWVDNTLELARTPQVLWPMDDEFDFRIVPSVRELDRLIRERAGEGATARLVAGFCWPWSNPDENGQLVPDVRVGDWEMPWNAQAGAGKLAPGIPKSDFWANDPNGINQVGCVYTAQGFEFDYVGVIFGPDLVYRPMDGGWVGQPKESFDRVVSRGVTTVEFRDFVKSTYRVLLTRGLRGCYTLFVDPGTRDYFLSRVERRPERSNRAASPASKAGRSS
ncbi:MAG: DUF2075 domain-containing protein [Candidatus Wallbacteria bacterium]|nr:DUF2075 domain-containing protein [Candidatus Wallbacteria bacterium]